MGLLIAGTFMGKQEVVSSINNYGQAQAIGSQELLRFHVLANSDEKDDQRLKNEVKDILVRQLQEELKESQNLAEAREIIIASLPRLEELARKEIESQGYQYSVISQIGNFSFPTRMYGTAIYPAGEYEAVRIIIGQGQGENWWCVLYPSLCFVEGTKVVSENNENKALGEVSKNQANQPTVVVKSKLWEVITSKFK